MKRTIQEKLKARGIAAIAAWSAGLVAVFLLHRHVPGLDSVFEATRTNSLVLLLSTTTFSLAIPILLRTGFYRKSVRSGGLSEPEFLRMKNGILLSVLCGELCMLFAYLVPIYTYHLYLSVLVGLYGIYSIFPAADTTRRELLTYGVVHEHRK
jgi:hypothetical protein